MNISSIQSYVGLILLLAILPFSAYPQGNSENQFIKAITPQEAGLTQGQQIKLERLTQNPMNRQVQLVRVGNLKTLQHRGALPIQIPGRNGALVAHATHVEAISDTDFVWNGEFRQSEYGSVMIIAKSGAIYGQINIENDIYRLRDLGDGKNVLIQLDESRFSPTECATPHGLGRVSTESNAISRHHCFSNVRVLVLFTDAANLVGNPQNDANLFINQTNQALRNSDISTHGLNLELVGVQRLAGFVEDADDIFDDRDLLRQNVNARNFREQFEADLVVLLTDGDYFLFDPANGCFNNNDCPIFGVAYVDEAGDEEFGYAITEIDAAGGRFTFAHEIAHLFGARHDTDPTAGFAHGHNFTTGSLWWKKTRRTILNSLPGGESRIQHYSNPNVQFSGKSTGITNQRDNARQLIALACDVADYRDVQLPPMTVTISGPTSMANGSYHSWCAEVENCETATYTWAWSDNGFTYQNIGTDRCLYLLNAPTNANHMFLRVIVTCADGQTATIFHSVTISSNPYRVTSEHSETSFENITSNILSLKVFPNPSREYVNVELDLDTNTHVDIQIFDILGRQQVRLYEGELAKGRHDLHQSLAELGTGIYTLVVKTGNNIKATRLLIQK